MFSLCFRSFHPCPRPFYALCQRLHLTLSPVNHSTIHRSIVVTSLNTHQYSRSISRLASFPPSCQIRVSLASIHSEFDLVSSFARPILSSTGSTATASRLSHTVASPTDRASPIFARRQVAVVLSGRQAGKKVVVIKQYDDGTKERPYPHAIVAGIEKYPLKVTKSMGAKRVSKRSKVKPFIKVSKAPFLLASSVS